MSQTVVDARFSARVVLHILTALGHQPHRTKWIKAVAGQLASHDPQERGQPWWFGIVTSVSECMLNDADHAAFAERQAAEPAKRTEPPAPG